MIRVVLRHRLSAVFGTFCLAAWFYEFDPTSLWSWFMLVFSLAAVVVFLFIARAYIAPYVVTRFSSHLRVRSISLRSIRGLYFRRGNRTWHVERIGYSYRSSGEGKPRGILLKIQGLRIEVEQLSREQPARTKHRRRITLVDLSPSPLALHLWSIMSPIYRVFDPIIRPIIRISVTSILNQVIHRIPTLTQALRLELESAVIAHTAIPDAQLVIEGATLDAHLTFSYLQVPVPHSDKSNGQGDHRLSAAALAMGAWKSRLVMGFKRTWRRAWDSTLGQTKASLTFDLMVNKVIGDTPIHSHLCGEPIIYLSETVTLKGAARFSPRDGKIEAGSVEVTLRVPNVHVSIDRWQSILAIIDDLKTKNTQFPAPPLLTSPISLQSPMLSSESSSASFNRPRFSSPPARSRKRKSHTPLSLLSKIQVDICSINVTKTFKGDIYRASVQDVSCVCSPSDPDHNSSHRAWLGSHHSSTSSVYVLQLKIRESALRRLSNVFTSSLQVLLVGALDASVTASEWPSFLQQISPGDPNRPLLIMDLKLAEFAVTDRLDVVHRLLSSQPTSSPPHASPALPETLSPIPRIIVNIEVGHLSARLICVDEMGSQTPFSLVVESKGFNAHCMSTFRTKPSIACNSGHTFSDRTGLHMMLQWDFRMEPVFLNLNTASLPRRASRRFSTHNLNSEGFDSLLSLEAVESKGTLTAVGEFIDDGRTSFNLLCTKSLFLDLHCYTEGIILELWHPQSVAAVIAVIPLLLVKESTPAPSDQPLILPLGFAVSLSVARLVLFVTGRNFNPNAESDVTCGVAFSTGIATRYCSMRPEQVQSVEHASARAQNRHKLYLPADYLAEALVSARACATSNESAAYGKLVLWNTSLRSAAADTYSMDDPYIFEKDDLAFNGKKFVFLHRTEVDVTSRGTRLPSSGTLQCSTHAISATVDEARLSFDLSHVTASLIALQVVRNTMPSRPTQMSSGSRVLSWSFRGMVKALQIQWNLPGQQPVTRVNYLEATVSPRNAECYFDSFVFWVPMPAKPHRWREIEEGRWEELARLHKCTISYGGKADDAILIEGDSIRFAVPSGYVLADLLLAITLTIKASRHIHRMVSMGTYFPHPPPEAEGPKVVPSISVSIRAICLEAADDPFESQLGLLWRTGLDAAKERIQREDAFDAKVAAILAAEGADASPSHNTAFSSDYQFDAGHSISVHEARERLHMVHSLDWLLRHKQQKQKRAVKEDDFHRNFRGSNLPKRPTSVPNLVNFTGYHRTPPLFRAVIYGFKLQLSQPSFPLEQLPDFLYVQGQGVPKDTFYTLLVPMHLDVALTSLRVTLRDYPLPLLHIPFHSKGKDLPVLRFISDLVVSEDMGPSQSVEWISCTISGTQGGFVPSSPLIIDIPKTIMPVKTYANPTVEVMTDGVTAFGWGVSYSATTQDLVRVLETLTSETRDPSPSIGFWDKLRLIFHWTIEVSFTNEARLYMKGTRDPYTLHDEGAGFGLCWKGNPKLLIGFSNDVNELIQVSSDTMSIIIPKFHCEWDAAQNKPDASDSQNAAPGCLKTCAKLGSGVRFGVGVILERSCSSEDCTSCCPSSSFDRHCRFFTFRPHHDVQLATTKPETRHDSYKGFRSDFIHLSVSLTSSLHPHTCADPSSPNSFHLTPHAFAHFWSWWALFDGNLSLPVRQGSYYPSKTVSPKFARHLATVKYRIVVPRLFISHVYIDDTRDSWVSGTTSFVGTKANVGHFQADMHQRDQESIAPGDSQDSIKVVRHKPFYAAEVVMKDMDLRAMLATFSEPLKQAIPLAFESDRDASNATKPLPTIAPSDWIDVDDFVETNWSSKHEPDIRLLPLLLCSRLTYFKKNATSGPMEGSKFGVEDTHTCLLGSEPSVPQIEVELANHRIAQLRDTLSLHGNEGTSTSLQRMIALLQDYVNHLRMTEYPHTDSRSSNIENYYMPSETVEADEWAEFENVYQLHAPKVFMNDSIRDIMLQYYNCSKARQGFEYHMATRAVKFIRDQAETVLSTGLPTDREKLKSPVNTAQTAATVLKRILNRDRNDVSIEVADDVADDGAVNPLAGWDEGVVLQKRHFCLLLKPQIVLRSEGSTDSVSVLAAVQAKLQSFTIMDKSNLEDPVSGTIMTRSYMALDGLQTFCPVDLASCGNGCVPLEVLIDYRCESDSFDRIVPQTNATCQYDRFNRLRLRNNVTSVTRSVPDNEHRRGKYAHLQNETDLVQVRVPRFTVSASDRYFQSISNIITNLILFTDAAHKTRLERLEALLFAYDFTDFASAANVVSDLQSRLRNALETRRDAENHALSAISETRLEIIKLKAHIFLLTEELNLIFDAIKLAQDRADERSDQKSALLLLASSSEISWQMLDDHQELLAKLAVRDIDFSWLSKQDSSTMTNLVVGDLQAFDGSPHALWPEIVSKFEDPSNHHMCKRGVFLDADWAVLAPVGGITIYEKFQLDFHPIRLQLDASLGQRIMEYVWPARRSRNRGTDTASSCDAHHLKPRASLDSSKLLNQPRSSLDSTSLTPPLRKLGSSRSFTDLRSAAADSMITPYPVAQSNQRSLTADALDESRRHRHAILRQVSLEHKTDFDEMKTRSSQKNFVLVKISSLELLLSIMKASSFECRDARIRTHALEIRNQTWSFEELVDQFIPSDLTWKGWVKIALHQPLVPVFPVARELFSKTKLTASRSVSQLDPRPTRKILKLKPKRTDTNSTVAPARPRTSSSCSTNPGRFIGMSLTDEPTDMDESTPAPTVPDINRPLSRARLLSVFSRSRRSLDNNPDSGRQSVDNCDTDPVSKEGP